MSLVQSLRRTLVAMAGISLIVAGSFAFVTTADAEVSTPSAVPAGATALHNATASTGTDCPDDGFAYWHFVLAPNDGSMAFTSITLDLGTEVVTFSGEAIVPNGSQLDNVFVGVPAGHTLTDIVLGDDSYALVTGGIPVTFNLSHTCAGVVPTTTTTTSGESTTTSTTEATTTTTEATTTTTEATTTTTEATTTTTAGESTTTTEASTTTEAPTTTAPSAAQAEVLGTVQTPAAAVQSTGSLPYTGNDTLGLVLAGLAVATGGLLLAGLARTRVRAE
jgi:hypothetical protein